MDREFDEEREAFSLTPFSPPTLTPTQLQHQEEETLALALTAVTAQEEEEEGYGVCSLGLMENPENLARTTTTTSTITNNNTSSSSSSTDLTSLTMRRRKRPMLGPSSSSASSSASSSSMMMMQMSKEEEEEKENRTRLKLLLYRRDYYRRTHPFVRIPTSDIRKQFPMIWLNIINSSDPTIYYTYIKHLLHRHAILDANSWDPKQDKGVIQCFPSLTSQSPVIRFLNSYLYRCVTSDDMICQLHGYEIRRSRHYSGTDIVFNFRQSYTILYDVTMSMNVDQSSSLLDNENQLKEQYNTMIANRRLSTRPLKVIAEGMMIHHFDEASNYIDKYGIYIKNISARPL